LARESESDGVAGAQPEHPAVAALYDEHKAMLYKVAYRAAGAGGREVAEDAIHDVFVNLLANYPEGVGSWPAYLVTAVKNRVKDRLSKGFGGHESANSEGVDVVNRASDQREPRGVDPAERAEQDERAKLVRSAIVEVWEEDPEAAHAFWEIVVCERTSAEVAIEAGVSPARIRQRKSDARALLKVVLAKKGVSLD